jgi:hypothetical protein
MARRQFSPASGLPKFNTDTNREIYRLANSRIRHLRSDARHSTDLLAVPQ